MRNRPNFSATLWILSLSSHTLDVDSGVFLCCMFRRRCRSRLQCSKAGLSKAQRPLGVLLLCHQPVAAGRQGPVCSLQLPGALLGGSRRSGVEWVIAGWGCVRDISENIREKDLEQQITGLVQRRRLPRTLFAHPLFCHPQSLLAP